MKTRFDEYHENADLYLEMLRDAQLVEDLKLVRMIKRRLETASECVHDQALTNCKIIQFPCYAAMPMQPIERQQSVFWPQFAGTQVAFISVSYLCIVMGRLLLDW